MNESALLTSVLITNGVLIVYVIWINFSKNDKKQEKERLQILENERQKNRDDYGIEETNEEREKREIFTNAAEKLINDKNSTIGQLISEQGFTINTLNEDTRRSIENTDRLLNILNNTNRRGQYGEMNLKSLLDIVEFKENTHYLKSKKIANGNIPDFTFNLPENKVVHVDCKFSTSKANQKYKELKKVRETLDDETNDEEYQKLEKSYNKEVKKFVDATRDQIDDLVEREYAGADENTLDFVFLYIPIESSYAFLIEQRVKYQERNIKFDIPLLEYAIKNRVILTNPSLMMAYLNTVRRSLMTHNLSENIRKISDLHNSFKLEWNSFVNSFEEIENALDDAKDRLKIYKDTRKNELQKLVNQMELLEMHSEAEEK